MTRAAGPSLSRRALLASGAGLLTAAGLAPGVARAALPPLPPLPAALQGGHAVVPLPFRPASLRGLSERLIVSHHARNYGGAVTNLNRVEKELASLGPSTPPFAVAALRERELTFRNSKLLHEAYFANLGGSGGPSAPVARALSTTYGSLARFEEQLRRTALGLGGGSGWVILALELDSAGLRVIGSGQHTQALAAGVPLLVLDMYEHSYALDFGADHARYIEAFYRNVQWEQVERRLAKATRAAAVLRGP